MTINVKGTIDYLVIITNITYIFECDQWGVGCGAQPKYLTFPNGKHSYTSSSGNILCMDVLNNELLYTIVYYLLHC